jgi:ribosomal protein S18 acetylase RimI-like enzyme
LATVFLPDPAADHRSVRGDARAMTPKVLAIESPVQPPAAPAPAAQVSATDQHTLAPVRVRGMRRRSATPTPETAPTAARPSDRPRTVSARRAAGCQVRRLGPDDAAAFQALRLEGLATDPCAFAASHDEEAGHSLIEVAARLERQPVFGAMAEGVLLAVAGFSVPEAAKKRHKGVLWGVYVREPARGRGLGRAVVARVIEHAGAHVVQLHAAVAKSNEAARRLYRDLGFEPYGLEPRGLACAGRYFDQELMILMLDGER